MQIAIKNEAFGVPASATKVKLRKLQKYSVTRNLNTLRRVQ